MHFFILTDSTRWCDYIAQLGLLVGQGPALAKVKRALLQHGSVHCAAAMLRRYLHWAED